MHFKNLTWMGTALLLATVLVSCNIGKAPEPTADVNAIYTSAAGTLIAQVNDQQTQTAQAVSPTPLVSPTALATFTPLPTFPVGTGSVPFGTPFTLGTPGAGLTPLPSPLPNGTLASGYAVGCDNATLIGETVPDGTREKGGEVFEKSWDFLNSGTCTWDEGYSFAFKSGDQMQGNDIKIDLEKEFTKPGHTQNFIVQLTPPIRAGEYKGFWQMKNDSGVWFGSLVWVDIIIK